MPIDYGQMPSMLRGMNAQRYADYMMADRVIEIRSRFIERMQASDTLPYGTVQWLAAITDTDGNVLQSSTWLPSRLSATWEAGNLWDKMWELYEANHEAE